MREPHLICWRPELNKKAEWKRIFSLSAWLSLSWDIGLTCLETQTHMKLIPSALLVLRTALRLELHDWRLPNCRRSWDFSSSMIMWANFLIVIIFLFFSLFLCLYLITTLPVPTTNTSATLAFSVSQTCQGHLNQGTLTLVVSNARNSHDSSHSAASSYYSDIGLNVIFVIYITMGS